MTYRKYRVIGYVKLAKLWERSRSQAIEYHREYYKIKYENSTEFSLVDVLVDITGAKQIYKRKQMLKLLSSCKNGAVDVIAVQTKAYLAANAMDLFYLLKYLFDLPHEIEIVSEDADMQIDTIANQDNQKQELSKMADKFVALDRSDYNTWMDKVNQAIDDLNE